MPPLDCTPRRRFRRNVASQGGIKCCPILDSLVPEWTTESSLENCYPGLSRICPLVRVERQLHWSLTAEWGAGDQTRSYSKE